MPQERPINSLPFSDLSLKSSETNIVTNTNARVVQPNSTSSPGAVTITQSYNDQLTAMKNEYIAMTDEFYSLSRSEQIARVPEFRARVANYQSRSDQYEKLYAGVGITSSNDANANMLITGQTSSSALLQTSNPSISETSELGDPTDNTTVQDTDTDQQETILTYLDNLGVNALNRIDQATYHLKLFLVDNNLLKGQPDSIEKMLEANPNLFSNENIIIIAESGVNAGIYIDRFVVDNRVILGQQMNTAGVGANIILKEPLGANFIDYYNDALFSLNYDTRLQPELFMEISFRGYNEDGTYISSDDIGTKIYRFVLANIEADLVGSGTTYTLDLKINSDIARELGNTAISDNLTVSGKTVKDFYDAIIAEWNKQQKDIEEDSKTTPAPTTGTTGASPTADKSQANLETTESQDTPTPVEKHEYGYAVTESCVKYAQCLDWEVSKALAPDRLRNANTTFNQEKGTIEATWSSGTSRVLILHDILMSTKEAQTLIVNGKEGSEIKPGSKEPGSLSFIPEIDIGLATLDYNKETNSYNKRITYYVQERQTTQIISSQGEYVEAAKSKSALIQKLKYVRRRYDYFGTGKNTEITNLNIKLSSDLKLNLPAYVAQKRTAVADNPGTGTEEVQLKQVAEGNKSSSSEGVKAPTPVNPDVRLEEVDTVTGSATTATVETDTVAQQASQSSFVSMTLSRDGSNAEAYYQNAGIGLDGNQKVTYAANQATLLKEEFSALSPEERTARASEYNSKIAGIQKLAIAGLDESQAARKAAYANALTDIDSQLANVAGSSTNVDSVSLKRSNSTSVAISNSSTQTSGTLAYGAISQITSSSSELSGSVATVSNGSSTRSEPAYFLEDMNRNRSDSPRPDRQDMERPGFVSTPIHSSGGYNLDDTVGIGKSFVAAILGQVYGSTADMAELTMEIRGDPFWLAVTNKAHTDQAGSLSVGSELIEDQKILLVVVFPTQYNDSTGLAIPNKISEGFTAIYNVINVTSTFENGRFVQTLLMRRDLATEQVRQYIDPVGGANI